VAKREMGGKDGDGWLRVRWLAKREMGGLEGEVWLRGRWVAKLVARLLATAHISQKY
jgi:hypothetical protein